MWFYEPFLIITHGESYLYILACWYCTSQQIYLVTFQVRFEISADVNQVVFFQFPDNTDPWELSGVHRSTEIRLTNVLYFTHLNCYESHMNNLCHQWASFFLHITIKICKCSHWSNKTKPKQPDFQMNCRHVHITANLHSIMSTKVNTTWWLHDVKFAMC